MSESEMMKLWKEERKLRIQAEAQGKFYREHHEAFKAETAKRLIKFHAKYENAQAKVFEVLRNAKVHADVVNESMNCFPMRVKGK